VDSRLRAVLFGINLRDAWKDLVGKGKAGWSLDRRFNFSIPTTDEGERTPAPGLEANASGRHRYAGVLGSSLLQKFKKSRSSNGKVRRHVEPTPHNAHHLAIRCQRRAVDYQR
jgi:hypothetical protein